MAHPLCPHFSRNEVDFLLKQQFKKEQDGWIYSGKDQYQDLITKYPLETLESLVNEFFKQAYPAALVGKQSVSFEVTLTSKEKGSMGKERECWKYHSPYNVFRYYPNALSDFVEKIGQVTERCFHFKTRHHVEETQGNVFWDISWESTHALLHPKPVYFSRFHPLFNSSDIKEKLHSIAAQNKSAVDSAPLVPIVTDLLKEAWLISRRGSNCLMNKKSVRELPQNAQVLIKELMKTFEITFNIKDTPVLSWKTTNPFLCPSNFLEPPVETAQAAYFGTLLQTGQFSNVTVQVGERAFTCHRAFLAAAGFFKNDPRELIPFDACDAETFLHALEFYYCGKLPPIEKCVQLFQLALYLEDEALEEVTKWQIFAYTKKDNYSQVAQMLKQLNIQDYGFDRLFGWFAKSASASCPDVLFNEVERVVEMQILNECPPRVIWDLINIFLVRAYPKACEGKRMVSFEWILTEYQKGLMPEPWNNNSITAIHGTMPHVLSSFAAKIGQVTKRCFNFETRYHFDEDAGEVHWDISWPPDHALLHPKPSYFPRVYPQFTLFEIQEKIKDIAEKNQTSADHVLLATQARKLLKLAVLENQKGRVFFAPPASTFAASAFAEGDKELLAVLMEQFAIQCNFTTLNGTHVMYMSWTQDNSFLSPITFSEPPVQTSRKAYFGTLLKRGEFSDVTIQVGEKLFTCHRAILAASGFFKNLFGSHHKDAKAPLIKFDRCSAETFSDLLEFHYTGKFPPKEKRIEMVQLAYYLNNEALKDVVKWQIFTFGTDDDYLQLTYMLAEQTMTQDSVTQDSDLEALCDWFVSTYFSGAVDLSKLSTSELLRLYQIGRTYKCTTLVKSAEDQFTAAFNPATDLIPLCQMIGNERSLLLREFLKSYVENTGFFTQLDKPIYAEHAQAYKRLTELQLV